MPTLEFKGKQHIYSHYLTVLYRPLEPDETRSCNPSTTNDNLIGDIVNSFCIFDLTYQQINIIIY